ncbi:hypothetical protein ZWY2020_042047 [Hordeum vulgare]|nr:hypothetical protein ZWY2020_042047 [Hordeum vulgare]
MAKVMNLTPVHASSIPDSFLLPADRLHPATTDVSLPIIDMSRGRDEVRQAILDSGKEYGFIQVVNHGISEPMLHEMSAVCHEFFDMPRRTRRSSSHEERSEQQALLRLRLETLSEEVVGNYTSLARGVAMEILGCCARGGTRPDFFVGDISGGPVVVDINYYPPSPNPSRTLGLPPHYDRDLMTVLLPGAVPGLEIATRRLDQGPARAKLLGYQLRPTARGRDQRVSEGCRAPLTTNFAEPGCRWPRSLSAADDCVVDPAEDSS